MSHAVNQMTQLAFEVQGPQDVTKMDVTHWASLTEESCKCFCIASGHDLGLDIIRFGMFM